MKRLLSVIVLAGVLAFNASALTGDVNGDSEVNISDVNALIDMILTDKIGRAHV